MNTIRPVLTCLFLSLALILPTQAEADNRPPKVEITKVERKNLSKGYIAFNFLIKATDNVAVKHLEYRVRIDGDDSGWRKYPYYDFKGYQNAILIQVDCNLLIFQVRSVDNARNKSIAEKKTYSNLQ